MKRAGFTMIELIFVIVILGILAAVAIPKLAATRTDAQVAKMATNAATVISDIGSHFTSQGSIGTNWFDMTNVALESASGTVSDATTTAAKIFDTGSTPEACVTYTVNSATDGNVTISVSKTSATCKAVALKIAPLVKDYVFGGIGIK
ncbi:MAG: hypothetical protein SPLUMA1_SPLUMAMAG1_00297 [uncultured Sulfurimonas sp.]|nr:MAG: hypothetical protein SPLUMA1_SPLUMAMAG1_00297 [uncultured Sulfurimonas sp.]